MDGNNVGIRRVGYWEGGGGIKAGEKKTNKVEEAQRLQKRIPDIFVLNKCITLMYSIHMNCTHTNVFFSSGEHNRIYRIYTT